MLAGDLHAGEPVRTLDGQAAIVVWVHTVPGQADYYNLTVADDHTYVVGASRAVVHNDGVCPGDNLPEFAKGGKTSGDFIGPDGTPRRLLSGHSDPDIAQQPRTRLPDQMPGMPKSYWNWDHVEAHAASLMRLEGIQDADLWINNPAGPCAGILGCNAQLPHMLPEGATLRVHYPGGPNGSWIKQPYVGRPESQWILGR